MGAQTAFEANEEYVNQLLAYNEDSAFDEHDFEKNNSIRGFKLEQTNIIDNSFGHDDENINSMEQQLTLERSEVLQNIVIAGDRMRSKRRWKYDDRIYLLGDQLILASETDGNPNTKKMPLNDHLYTPPFEVVKILGETLHFKGQDGKVLESIHKSRVRPILK